MQRAKLVPARYNLGMHIVFMHECGHLKTDYDGFIFNHVIVECLSLE